MSESDLPPPLVPPEVDLHDFAFMPLEVARLRRSKAWLIAKKRPALGFYMINLWAASWHDRPAGSLEDDDEVLADLAICDVKTWTSVREVVLRGWVKCSDGRLYHPIVAEKARESWAAKVAQRERTKAATEAREARRRAEREASQRQRDEQRNVERDGARDDERNEQRDGSRDVHQGTGTVKGQGQGQGQGIGLLPFGELSGSAPDDARLNGKRPYIHEAEKVLSYLNATAGRAFEFRNPSGDLTPNADTIIARLKEGYTPEQLREVVLLKAEQWRGDEKMAEYLRPQTLFGKQKFAQYVGELGGANGGH